MVKRLCITALITLACLLSGMGCASRQQGAATPPALTQPATQAIQTTPPVWVQAVRATCHPPADWRAEPLKKTNLSEHQLWISPTGATAYGVLNVRHLLMPLASDERILTEFLDGMHKSEGSAELLEKKLDPSLANSIGGLRFVAKGGTYTVRANLASSGRYAWIWYAGTLTGKPIEETELRAAEAAREATRIGPEEPK